MFLLWVKKLGWNVDLLNWYYNILAIINKQYQNCLLPWFDNGKTTDTILRIVLFYTLIQKVKGSKQQLCISIDIRVDVKYWLNNYFGNRLVACVACFMWSLAGCLCLTMVTGSLMPQASPFCFWSFWFKRRCLNLGFRQQTLTYRLVWWNPLNRTVTKLNGDFHPDYF